MITVRIAEQIADIQNAQLFDGKADMARIINTLMKWIVFITLPLTITGGELDKAYRVPVIIGATLFAIVVLCVMFLWRRKPSKCTECSKPMKRRGQIRVLDGKVHRLCNACNHNWEAREAYRTVAMFQARQGVTVR
jgi:hypothetical protein